MIKRIYSVRGATTVEADSARAIGERSVELLSEIIRRNGIGGDRRFVHIIFSTTDDITVAYPATAVRLAGLTDAPLFSCKEPSVKGALGMCVRILAEIADYGDGDAPAEHVYLHGAAALRKDLTEKSK